MVDNTKEILIALRKLDVKNDDQWTQGGLPKMEALGGTFTRTEVTNVAPNFTRENPVVPGDESEPQTGGNPSEEARKEQDDTMLVGSSFQPAHFTLKSGDVLLLGDVVRQAYDASGVESAEDWNTLPDDDREAFIGAIVARLDLAATDEEEQAGEAAKEQKTVNDEMNSLYAEKDALEAGIQAAHKSKSEADNYIKNAENRLDELNTILFPKDSKSNQENIMTFLKQQNANRQKNAEHRQHLVTVGLAAPAKSALDNALSRPNKRPTRTPIG